MNLRNLDPPANLKSSMKKVDLDEITKLQRVFSNSPAHGAVTCTINPCLEPPQAACTVI